MYSPQDDTWTPIAHMMVPRCEFGLVAVDGCLYAFGGWVGEDIGGRWADFCNVPSDWWRLACDETPKDF